MTELLLQFKALRSSRVDSHWQIFKWPINTWAKDPQMKEIGAWNLINMIDGLEGFTIRLWTQVLGWSMEEIEVFLVDVRKDL